jgi:HSP20 family protein
MNLNIWKKPVTASTELTRLRDEMEQAFERFFTDPMGLMPFESRSLRNEGWLPALDVIDNENEVTIKAEVPGIPIKDLDINISGTTLTISGEKEELTDSKGENYYRCERRFGSFRRVVELPDTIDADKITADADNGLITVHVAKKPGAKPRTVEVRPVGKRVNING